MSLFWYQRTIVVHPPAPKEGEEQEAPKIINYPEALNLNKVVRAYYDENGQFTVLLDDGHEETHPVSVKRNKNGKEEIIKERAWYMSQIRLSPEDALRFRRNTDQEYHRDAKVGTVFNEQTEVIPDTVKDPVLPTEAVA